MIVYSASKEQFNNDVITNIISDKILDRLHERNIHAGEPAEYRAWQNSLGFMRNVLDDAAIPGDSEVAIEYQIPLTAKRVDFIIAGLDEEKKNNAETREVEKCQATASL